MTILITLVAIIVVIMIGGVVINFIVGIITGAALLLNLVVRHPFTVAMIGALTWLVWSGNLQISN